LTVRYSKLAAETFFTSFVPLSFLDAQTLVRFHGDKMVETATDVEAIARLTKGIDDAIAGFQVSKVLGETFYLPILFSHFFFSSSFFFLFFCFFFFFYFFFCFADSL
jgi:hypothetical protein